MTERRQIGRAGRSPSLKGLTFLLRVWAAPRLNMPHCQAAPVAQVGLSVVKPYRASHSKDPGTRGPSWLFSQMAL